MLPNGAVVEAGMCHPEHPSGLRYSFLLAARFLAPDDSQLYPPPVVAPRGRELPHLKGSLHAIIAGCRTTSAQFPS